MRDAVHLGRPAWRKQREIKRSVDSAGRVVVAARLEARGAQIVVRVGPDPGVVELRWGRDGRAATVENPRLADQLEKLFLGG